MTRTQLRPLEDRGPLRVMFLLTSMPVGGAETLLVELVRRLDRQRFLPEIGCLKQLDVLGEVLAREVPAHCGLIKHKYDVAVLPRLARLLRQRRIDAVVTVGAGDKMFWGRLAGRLAGVPVVCSAIHSTGYPDGIGWLNRRLGPLTDAFIAVAEPHARHLVDEVGCPAARVHVVPNGVDTDRFAPAAPAPPLLAELDLAADGPTAAIVAALRPEKNHELLLRAAAAVRRRLPDFRLLVVGDGPRRPLLEGLSRELGLQQAVRFLGTRSDVPAILAAVRTVVLCSKMEANPVSILEAFACGKPVVATRVGSVAETVVDGFTGRLVEAGDADGLAAALIDVLGDPPRAAAMGANGRRSVVDRWSIDAMIRGYQDLLSGLYNAKASTARGRRATAAESQPLGA